MATSESGTPVSGASESGASERTASPPRGDRPATASRPSRPRLLLRRIRRLIRPAPIVGPVVLVYHGIGVCGQSPVQPTWLTDPTVFARQVRALGRRRTIVPLDRFSERASQGRLPDPDWAAITFDDAFESVWTVARPILARMQLPAAIAVPTGPVLAGDRSVWPVELRAAIDVAPPDAVATFAQCDGPGGDPLMPAAADRSRIGSRSFRSRLTRDALAAAHAVPQAVRTEWLDRSLALLTGGIPVTQRVPSTRLMSVEQLRQAAHGGQLTLISHTSSHPLLTGEPAAARRDELTLARSEFGRLTDGPCDLAYPFGAVDEPTAAAVAAAGFRVAYSARPDADFSGRYRLPRLNPGHSAFRLARRLG